MALFCLLLLHHYHIPLNCIISALLLLVFSPWWINNKSQWIHGGHATTASPCYTTSMPSSGSHCHHNFFCWSRVAINWSIRSPPATTNSFPVIQAGASSHHHSIHHLLRIGPMNFTVPEEEKEEGSYTKVVESAESKQCDARIFSSYVVLRCPLSASSS